MFFSIIMPTYNPKPDLIINAILSCREQTFADFELIIVDDGSDNHWQESVPTDEPWIRVLTKGHAGVSAARNYGISCAAGTYLVFLDSDDVLCTDCLEMIHRHILACGVPEPPILLKNFEVREADDPIHPCIRKGASGWVSEPEAILAGTLNRKKKYLGIIGSNQELVCSREFLSQYDIWFDESMHYGEDTEIFFRIFQKADRIYYMNAITSGYTRNEASVTRQYSYDTERKIAKKVRTMFSYQDAFSQIPKADYSVDAMKSYAETLNLYRNISKAEWLSLTDCYRKYLVYAPLSYLYRQRKLFVLIYLCAFVFRWKWASILLSIEFRKDREKKPAIRKEASARKEIPLCSYPSSCQSTTLPRIFGRRWIPF